ncbi:MAG: sulfatase [Planctomycetaceae bacterium]
MRTVPVIAVLTAVLLPGRVFAESSRSGTNERPPNVIVVFCDDMGYADIGPFGAKGDKTPNLDRMAREGMKFTSFVVARSVCSPSRAALLTGCYPLRVGVPGNFGPGSRTGLHPDEMTLAELVKQRSYATAMLGKWHLGHRPKFLPVAQGFDEWYGLPYSHDMWPYHPEQGVRYRFPDLPLMEGTKVVNPRMQPKDVSRLTTQYTKRAVAFIKRSHKRPFLLYLAHAMPHVPLFVSKRHAGKTKRGLYGDVISEIDWSMGRILDTLRALKIDKQTLVIFTSDNGPWLLYGDHAGSARPLREGKGTPFEGGYRVPCVMWWPGKIPADSVCSELASTIDILPTVAHLTGARLPKRKIDGKNIWPLMAGRKGARSPHDAFYYYSGLRLSGIRSGRWKLMFAQTFGKPDPPGKNGKPGRRTRGRIPLSLFDLEADVGERKNVADKHPTVVKRLQQLAKHMRDRLGDGRTRKGTERRPVGR